MLWWSTLNCASSSLPSARAEPGRLIVPVKEKELRIKRPLIGVKVAKLPFLTSARDKALESPALWRGKGISQLCIPLSPSQMESSQEVFLVSHSTPLEHPFPLPTQLPGGFWKLRTPFVFRHSLLWGSKSLQAMQPGHSCCFLWTLPHTG